ncbi:hypothetical protein ACHHYP_09304 [Achlya hypogyna]|uniref:Uncharacterized protein n=1 Tax=Achlya hypogyna TaxID=1202772 RepID=A0A1V9YNG7_ACHHY|nr:hypothetical protein ACHHYP_09304 [Achlya hypogyna]
MVWLNRTATALVLLLVCTLALGGAFIGVASSWLGAAIHGMEPPWLLMFGIALIVLAVVGLASFVFSTIDKCYTLHRVLLLLLVAVLIGFVVCAKVKALSSFTTALNYAPAFTTYQHRMEEYLSNASLTTSYLDVRIGWDSEAPRKPTLNTDEKYPMGHAVIFSEAYCQSEASAFCDEFPFASTVVVPDMWRAPNMTFAAARALATLPTTFANVTVTATTTINSFCAEFMPLNNSNRDLEWMCNSCKSIPKVQPRVSKVQPQIDQLARWIHATCPMRSAKPTGAYCLSTVECQFTEGHGLDLLCAIGYSGSYVDPFLDRCFGTTLMATAVDYVWAAVVTSSVIAFAALILSWRLRTLHKAREAQALSVRTPIDEA